MLLTATDTLAPQLHVRKARPDAAQLRAIKNDWCKPHGGLWTSTYDVTWGSDWIQWRLRESFRLRAGDSIRCWKLTPKPDARIYHIDAYADLEQLTHAYPFQPYREGSTYLDFERIAHDYDAIHLTEAGQWATRLSHPYDLYGWDCESTAWLRWAFDDVQDLGECIFPVKED